MSNMGKMGRYFRQAMALLLTCVLLTGGVPMAYADTPSSQGDERYSSLGEASPAYGGSAQDALALNLPEGQEGVSEGLVAEEGSDHDEEVPDTQSDATASGSGNGELGLEDGAFQTGASGESGISPAASSLSGFIGSAHVSRRGDVDAWEDPSFEGAMLGRPSDALQMEGFALQLDPSLYPGTLRYRAHVQNLGWTTWSNDGAFTGTSGRNLQLEAMEFRLEGGLEASYDLYYRSYVSGIGWMAWASNGLSSGTVGCTRPVYAIQVLLKPVGQAAPPVEPGAYPESLIDHSVGTFVLKGSAHIGMIGDTAPLSSNAFTGLTLGTTGYALRMEGLSLELSSAALDAGLSYQVHVEGIGWMSAVDAPAFAGTRGQSKRVEAVRINLTGAIAASYDLYYRAHSQNLGWLGWAKNGEAAGSTGYSYRMEAIQIVLVEKGISTLPTGNHFVSTGSSMPVDFRFDVALSTEKTGTFIMQKVGGAPYVFFPSSADLTAVKVAFPTQDVGAALRLGLQGTLVSNGDVVDLVSLASPLAV
ncbi:MAG: hypothetical protein LBG81_02910 [Coriobacteriaceae bacterium]|nr:hypothetical protein [Coriobacteriaceae bacterium]